MERKLISEADSRPLVVLDPRAPASQDALDAAVRAAGSLLLHFARRTRLRAAAAGRPPRRRRSSPTCSAWPQAHVRLALLDDSHRARRWPPPRTAAGSSSSSPRGPSTAPPRGLGRTPGGCLIVVPGELPGRRAVLEVAGCHGYVGGRTGGAAAVAAVGRRRVSTAAAAAAARRTPARVDARCAGARAAMAFLAALRLRRAAVDADARARRPRSAPATRCSPPAAAICGAARSPGGCPARARTPAAVAVAIARLRARAARRRRRRRAAAARPLGRAGGRDRPRPLRRCPGARVPYRGLDEWTRAVICARRHRAGGARRARSRSGRGARELGLRHVSLRAARDALRRPGRRARPLARVPARRAAGAAGRRLPAARAAADQPTRARPRCSPSGSPILGLVAAPALDTRPAVVRLRDVGAVERLARSRPTFSWDHSYGPLDWPRDGRELLRVKAKRPAYWKATNLDEFDGAPLDPRPQLDEPRRLRRSAYLPAAPSAGLQSITRLRPQPAHATVRHRRLACAVDSPRLLLAAARRRHVREHEPRAAPRRRLHGLRLHAEPQRAPAPRGAAGPTRRRCSATPASSCRRRASPRPPAGRRGRARP